MPNLAGGSGKERLRAEFLTCFKVLQVPARLTNLACCKVLAVDLSKAFLLFFRRCLFDLSCLLVVVCFVCGGVSLLLESVCVGCAKELVLGFKAQTDQGVQKGLVACTQVTIFNRVY